MGCCYMNHSNSRSDLLFIQFLHIYSVLYQVPIYCYIINCFPNQQLKLMSIYYHTQFLRIRIQDHLSWLVLIQSLSGSCSQAARLVSSLLKTQLRLENSTLRLTHTVVEVLCHMRLSTGLLTTWQLAFHRTKRKEQETTPRQQSPYFII